MAASVGGAAAQLLCPSPSRTPEQSAVPAQGAWPLSPALPAPLTSQQPIFLCISSEMAAGNTAYFFSFENGILALTCPALLINFLSRVSVEHPAVAIWRSTCSGS